MTVGVTVLILPYRQPVVTAKQLATLDVLSGGRLILGCGIANFEPEFLRKNFQQGLISLLTHPGSLHELSSPWFGRSNLLQRQLDVLTLLGLSAKRTLPKWRGDTFWRTKDAAGLASGVYLCTEPLRIKKSNVRLRGSGDATEERVAAFDLVVLDDVREDELPRDAIRARRQSGPTVGCGRAGAAVVSASRDSFQTAISGPGGWQPDARARATRAAPPWLRP